MTDLEGITVVTERSQEMLNERQLLDYRRQRENCLEWLLIRGLDPEMVEGYARGTVKPRSARMDQFYRWLWNEKDSYTADVTHDHADAYMEELATQDNSNAHKAACQKAIQMLMKWRHHKHGLEPWEPPFRFNDSSKTTQPRDFLTRDERRKIREAALELGTIPGYNDLSPKARDRWKAYLAQRFEKPKSDVSPSDWDKANGWKIPSLTWVSLDAGLRPIEVERAVVSWVDLANCCLRIPKEESSKNTEHWRVSLQQRTADSLESWLKERENYAKYEDTEKVWLTRNGNPWTSSSLIGLIERLWETAGIATENRKMSWYSIRHSVGTYMTREEDLAAAQAQLRHKSPETTMKYDQAPVEDRRDALDRMG
jgi:integrase